MMVKKKEEYKPKVFDFRASSRFEPQPDGSVKYISQPHDCDYIDTRDTVILDPIL